MKRNYNKFTIRMLLTIFNAWMIIELFIDDPEFIGIMSQLTACILVPLLYYYMSRLIFEPRSITVLDDAFKIKTFFKTYQVLFSEIDHVVLCIHSKKSAMLVIKKKKKGLRLRKTYFPDFDSFCSDLEDVCRGRFKYNLRKYSSTFMLAKPYVEKVKWQNLYNDKPSIRSYFLGKKFVMTFILIIVIIMPLLIQTKTFLLGMCITLTILFIGLVNYRRGFSFEEALTKGIRWLCKSAITTFSIVYFLVVYLNLI